MADSEETKSAPTATPPRRLAMTLAVLEGAGAGPVLEPTAPTPLPADPVELGGPDGPDPTRYGDWERKGRCIDF